MGDSGHAVISDSVKSTLLNESRSFIQINSSLGHAPELVKSCFVLK